MQRILYKLTTQDGKTRVGRVIPAQPAPRKRARPGLLVGRCCWVCGRPGGNGSTRALTLLGYAVKRGEIGYAHGPCLIKVQALTARTPHRQPTE